MSELKKTAATNSAPADAPTEGYRVLARKYRPASFDDLIGQDAMVRTISNAFESGRIPQAWILTGVRGVGKTTTARILARALNYELPDGSVKAFRTVSPDQLLGFVGSTSVKYIPINETVEMELGNDREVLVKPKLMNWVKTDLSFDNYGNIKGWTTKETWQVEVQNSKDIDIVLDLRRNFAGDWSLTTDASYEKVDANKVKFLLPLKPRGKQTFTYEVTTRHGTNANR